MSGLQGLLHDVGQVIPDRLQLHGVLEAERERGHHHLRVVAGPVEPAVHDPLHAPPQRAEQCRRRRSGLGLLAGRGSFPAGEPGGGRCLAA